MFNVPLASSFRFGTASSSPENLNFHTFFNIYTCQNLTIEFRFLYYVQIYGIVVDSASLLRSRLTAFTDKHLRLMWCFD